MHSHLHRSLILCTLSSSSSRFALPPSSNSLSTMASSSLTLPSISLHKQLPFNASSSDSLRIRSLRPRNPDRSRVFMTSVSVGSQALVNDSLFSDYSPTSAFLFPGQVCFLNAASFAFIHRHNTNRTFIYQNWIDGYWRTFISFKMWMICFDPKKKGLLWKPVKLSCSYGVCEFFYVH